MKPGLAIGMIVGDDFDNLKRNLHSYAHESDMDKFAVVSGGSTAVGDLLNEYGFKIHYRDFEDYADQRNYLLSVIGERWVLTLDSDEQPEKLLIDEARDIASNTANIGTVYFVPRKTDFMGRFMMHGGLYPDYRPCLFYNLRVHYEGAVHERLVHEKSTGRVRGHILHYSDNGLSARLYKVIKYSTFEASSFSRRPSILEVLFRPFGYFIKRVVLNGALLDGVAGLVWLVQATIAYQTKYLLAYYRYQNESRGKHTETQGSIV